MTKEEHLLKVIKENMERVDRIFEEVDFGKVALDADRVTDMNEFYMISKNPLRDFKETK